MNNACERRWPYLSPARPGWGWVAGYRGEIRRLLLRAVTVRVAAAGGPTGESPTIADPTEQVLETLEEMDQLIRQIEIEMLLLVTEAHYRGNTWSKIAARLNRSKQSVHQRYQRQVYARRTHEALRADLACADQRAGELARCRLSPHHARELRSFLRERRGRLRQSPSAGQPPAGALIG